MNYRLVKIEIGAVVALIPLIVSTLVSAKSSGSTDTIEGLAPTVTGKLFITGPNGDIESGAQLDSATKPSSYALSADLSELVLADQDEDLLLTAVLKPPSPVLEWKNGATTLTNSQLNQTFAATGLGGKVLTVTAIPLVTVRSTTGAPNVATVPFPQSYSFTVSDAPAVINVNGHNFEPSSGFPTTGFTGATYQIIMNGNLVNNSKYIWTTSQPSWMTVSNGNVTFTAKPTSEQKTYAITVTPKEGGLTQTMSATVGSWYTTNMNGSDAIMMNWSPANGWCDGSASRGVLPTVAQLTHSSKTGGTTSRGIGALWNEWGSWYHIGYSGFWTSEADSIYHYFVKHANGTAARSRDAGSLYVMCRQDL
ncbi:hypothetical protein [Serratia fonticola]